MVFEHFHLLVREESVLTARKRSIELDASKGNTLECYYPVVSRGYHPLYLMVFTLGEGDKSAHTVRVEQYFCALAFISVGKGYTVPKFLLNSLSHRLCRAEAVDLGYVVLR